MYSIRGNKGGFCLVNSELIGGMVMKAGKLQRL